MRVDQGNELFGHGGLQEGRFFVEEAVCIKESWCGSCVGRGEGSWKGDLVKEIVCGKGLWGVNCVGKGGERGLDLVE